MYTYLHNLQGDVIAIVDSTGAIVVEYKYNAWGKLLSTIGTKATTLGKLNPFRYRGYVYDEEIGFYYLQSRYYDAHHCRFINGDNVLGSGITLFTHNIFAYCRNNCVMYRDPTGHDIDPENPANVGGYSYVRVTAPTPTSKDVIPIIGVLGQGVLTLANLIRKYTSRDKTYTKTKSITNIAAENENEQKQHNYYQASIVKKKIVLGNPMTANEAALWVAQGHNVMCKDQAAAEHILYLNRYHNAVGPEKGCGDEFFWHYHPTRNHTGYASIHIWFLGGAK